LTEESNRLISEANSIWVDPEGKMNGPEFIKNELKLIHIEPTTDELQIQLSEELRQIQKAEQE